MRSGQEKRGTFEGIALNTLRKNLRFNLGANTVLLLRDLPKRVNAFVIRHKCCITASKQAPYVAFDSFSTQSTCFGVT